MVIWWAKKIIGGLLLASSCFSLAGLPGDIPTWYRCARYGGAYCPATSPLAMPSLDWSLLLKLVMLLVGIALLVPSSWWEYVKGAREMRRFIESLQFQSPVVMQRPQGEPDRQVLMVLERLGFP